eukprot:6209735-Pleurochrysis_carterae.AAC.3
MQDADRKGMRRVQSVTRERAEGTASIDRGSLRVPVPCTRTLRRRRRRGGTRHEIPRGRRFLFRISGGNVHTQQNLKV